MMSGWTLKRRIMRVPRKLLQWIRDKKDFLIVTHVKPEGDAIGSSLALALGLKKMGKSVALLDRDPVPYFLAFLPSSALFRQRPPKRAFDLLFLLDCNTLERAGFSQELKAEHTAIVDHHILRPVIAESIRRDPFTVSYIDPEASATGVLVFHILRALKIPLDKRIATNLYTSILVDTGGFRYSSTSPEALKIAAQLVQAGAKPWEISKELHESSPVNSLQLLGLALSTIRVRGAVAWISVTEDMLRQTGTTAEDTEDFVNFPRQVGGIEVAVLFRQDGSSRCKVSLRSKGIVNVAKVAEGFGGGGHAAAAGCRMNGSLQAVQEHVLKALHKAVKRR